MATVAWIGPIAFEVYALIEGDNWNTESEVNVSSARGVNMVSPKGIHTTSDSFSIDCTAQQAFDLYELSRRDELVWIDSTANYNIYQFPHRGWYYIKNVSLTERYHTNYFNVAIEIIKITNNQYDYLKMDYTNGIEDNTTLTHTYDDVTATHHLTDDFSTFDTVTNWESAFKSGMTTGSISSSGGKLVFTGQSDVDGTTGYMATVTQNSYDLPFYIEMDLEKVSAPAGYNHVLMFSILPSKPSTINEWLTAQENAVNVALRVASGGTTFEVSKKVDGAWTTLYSTTTTATVSGFKLKYLADTTLTVYFKEDGGSYSTVYNAKTGLDDYIQDLYLSYLFMNKDSTSASLKSSSIDVYSYTQSTYPNIVALPQGATLETTADFNRAGLGGNIPCYENPSDDLLFTVDIDTDPTNVYDGSVKVYNDTTPIYGCNTVYDDVGDFNMNNGLIKLIPDSGDDYIELYAYYGAAWNLVNKFAPGTGTTPDGISLIKIIYNTSEKVVVQVNRTYWHMWRGKPFVMVEHPYHDLGYIRKTCYYHDVSTTTDPAADADITMEDDFYCNIYSKGTGDCTTPDPADDYRLQIIQIDPTTIKSDYIPACGCTGIGWYDATETYTDPNGYLSIAQEFMTQTVQKIKYERS